MSNLEAFANDNFIVYQMVQLLPYMVENIVGKRENVLYQTTKNLDRSTLKAIADDKINVNKKLKFDMGRVENIVGKGENAGCQHFLFFPQCFQKASFSFSHNVYKRLLLLFPQCFQKVSFLGSLKVWIVWRRVNSTGSFLEA